MTGWDWRTVAQIVVAIVIAETIITSAKVALWRRHARQRQQAMVAAGPGGRVSPPGALWPRVGEVVGLETVAGFGPLGYLSPLA